MTTVIQKHEIDKMRSKNSAALLEAAKENGIVNERQFRLKIKTLLNKHMGSNEIVNKTEYKELSVLSHRTKTWNHHISLLTKIANSRQKFLPAIRHGLPISISSLDKKTGSFR